MVVVAAVAVHSNATNADRQDTLPEMYVYLNVLLD